MAGRRAMTAPDGNGGQGRQYPQGKTAGQSLSGYPRPRRAGTGGIPAEVTVGTNKKPQDDLRFFLAVLPPRKSGGNGGNPAVTGKIPAGANPAGKAVPAGTTSEQDKFRTRQPLGGTVSARLSPPGATFWDRSSPPAVPGSPVSSSAGKRETA